MRILLIEDQHPLYTKISNFLTNEGHTVVVATNLTDACSYLEMANEMDTPFDAILSDNQLKMPDGTISHARENYAAIRKIAGPQVPILGASADIVMWERVKEEEEDPRLFIHRKKSDHSLPGNHQYWYEPWVKSTLDQIKDLPPLPKKLQCILLAGKDQSFLDSTTLALQEAGYAVALCNNVMDEVQNILPRGNKRPKYTAVISTFELNDRSGADLFTIANLRKPGLPFLATGEDAEQWTHVRQAAKETDFPFCFIPQENALLLAQLTELGVNP